MWGPSLISAVNIAGLCQHKIYK